MKYLLALLLLWPSLALAAPSMTASQWTFRYSPGMPLHPDQWGSGWGFYFPVYNGSIPCRTSSSCPSVHMVTAPVAGVHGTSITVGATIYNFGAVVYNYKTEPTNTCGMPYAQARLYIERAVDSTEYGRFWSNPIKIDLKPGWVSVTVPLNASNWSSVHGYRSAGRLAQTLPQVRRVGMVFGGGCFYGHGVNVHNGQAAIGVAYFEIR